VNNPMLQYYNWTNTQDAIHYWLTMKLQVQSDAYRRNYEFHMSLSKTIYIFVICKKHTAASSNIGN
jgi:hypothetical protein